MAESDWATLANDAIRIFIFQPNADNKAVSRFSFHPEYTEQFFGQSQTIFGYRGLKIDIRFAAHDLYPNVSISYAEKFKQVGETKAADLNKILKQHLPAYAFDLQTNYEKRLKTDEGAASFKPPGELLTTYTVGDCSYEIWSGELVDPNVRTLIERVQIMIPFFIDGGLELNLKDEEWTLARWRVFFVYEKLPAAPTPTSSEYSLVGYSTAYRFLTYQPSTSEQFTQHTPLVFPPSSPIAVSSLPNRSRISQFLILPPHRGQSHGTHLYNAMFSTFLADPACIEITVEDPNESFDDLRDFCDYSRLLRTHDFSALTLNTHIDPGLTAHRRSKRVPTYKLLPKAILESLRAKNKLAPRQFSRLVELRLLSCIPKYSREAGLSRLTQKGRSSNEGDRAYYFWRLLVKQRIYRQSKDVLIQLESEERIQKLEEALESQAKDYERLLEQYEARVAKAGAQPTPAETDGPVPLRGKRKIIVIDDDEDLADSSAGSAAESANGQERAAKKPRESEKE